MKLDITVRKAKNSDVDVLARMDHDFQLSEKKVGDKYMRVKSVGELKKRITNHMKTKNIIFLIAEADGKPVGFSKGLIESYMEDYAGIGKVGFISITYLLQRYRRKGIGTMLYKRMLQEFKKRKVKMMTVFHYASNKPAIAFVKKLGFRMHAMELRKFI